MKISGSFSVKLQPLPSFANGGTGNTMGRMSIDKLFDGDLSASSKGEMLSAVSAIKGCAGYVAQELVSGTLNGKSGSFVLQHFGVMQNAQQRLILEVVPGSGTDELGGLTGKMAIRIENNQHFYDFDYELPA